MKLALSVKSVADRDDWYSCGGKIEGVRVVGHGKTHYEAIASALEDYAVILEIKAENAKDHSAPNKGFEVKI